MADLDALEGDVRALEEHVIGVDSDNPGLVMRMDRVERFLRALVWVAGAGFGWQVVLVVRDVVAALVKP